MKAAQVTSYESPPEFTDIDDPAGGEGMDLVDVEVAGLNPIDLAIASGKFDAGAPPLPYVPGREGIGTTPDGRRIWFDGPAFPYGSMAEVVPVPSGTGIVVPDGIDSADALAFGIAGMAAWLSLQWRGGLKAGETVLVLGASGSVGQIAIQAAKLMGAGRVVGAARSQSGRELVKELGADEVVDTGDEDFTPRIQGAAGGGVDLIIDNLWGEPAAKALLALNVKGRLIQVGNSAGKESPVKAGPLRGVAGSILAHRNFHAPLETQEAAFERMCRHFMDGELKIEVENVALEDVAEAWQRQAASPGHKLVLRP